MVICYVLFIYYEIKSIGQWAKECICNAGKMCFDAIQFDTKSSRIEIETAGFLSGYYFIGG